MNLDEKRIKLFRKLTKKSPSIIKNIRKIYLANELDSIDTSDYYDVVEKSIKNDVRKLSSSALIRYWIDCYDGDTSVLPARVINSLTDNEKITLDID